MRTHYLVAALVLGWFFAPVTPVFAADDGIEQLVASSDADEEFNERAAAPAVEKKVKKEKGKKRWKANKKKKVAKKKAKGKKAKKKKEAPKDEPTEDAPKPEDAGDEEIF